MRVDVKKFLFVGHEKMRASFFSEAQKIGFIQFSHASLKTVSEKFQLYTEALKILRKEPIAGQQAETLSPEIVAKSIKDLKNKIEGLDDKIKQQMQEIEQTAVFGNFSLKDLTENGLKAQFFYSKKKIEAPHLFSISSINELEYYFSIGKTSFFHEDLTEIVMTMSLKDQQEHLAHAQIEKKRLEQELAGLVCYKDSLKSALNKEIDQIELMEAQSHVDLKFDETLFTVTGFVPVNQIEKLSQLAIYSEEIAIEAHDRVPTCLDNKKWARVGEDLVNIYDTPSTQDKDPSLWVLFGFLLFFSMIIGDGGYGCIYLGLVLYIRYKNPLLNGLKRRLLNLAILLSAGCITWGILSSSFFGMSMAPDHSLRSFSLVHFLAKKKAAYHVGLNDLVYQKWLLKYPEIAGEFDANQIFLKAPDDLLASVSDNILLELSLFIGVCHLILGFFRYLKKNLANMGWILFLIGSYLYLPVFLAVPSLLNYVFAIPCVACSEVGYYLIGIGILFSLSVSVLKNGLLGLAEIMNLIQVFADVLSYLRLYALGLSGAILSSTINSMASHLPFFIAFILIVLGHMINMGLGLMGGVLHGLRLNFLEWYHTSFEGGGKSFKPLKINQL